jgi:hypothetical protein
MTYFSSATRRRLERIASEVAILGPRLFQLAADLPEMVSSEVTSYPNEPLPNDLVSSLTNALYLRFYCGLGRPLRQTSSGEDLLGPVQEANASVGGWDSGWQIVTQDIVGHAVVRSGTRTRLVALEDVHGADESDPNVGQVSIRRFQEDFKSQPGYYYAIGEALGDRYEDQVGIRIYLNLTADAAVTWMSWVTGKLNRFRVPFQFKVLRHPASFVRVDSGVIYVPRRHAGFACSLVTELAQSIGGLGDRTPIFARRIGCGISIADNPPGGGSFGLNRMKLVAEGHVDAWMGHNSNVPGRLKAIAARFRLSGLDPKRPWLNPGNTDVLLNRTVHRVCAKSGYGLTSWLGVSDRIGARLVRDAIWHRDQCTWLGWALVPEAAGSKPAVCTVGGDLYSGTAGIAIFLARLSAVTQDERQRVAAVGALQHAIAHTLKGRWGVGAYSGLGGILHAAIAVADACKCDEAATTMIRSLVEKLSMSQPDHTETDVLNGRAGAVRSLLYAAERGLDHDGRALQSAVRFGHEIIGLAERRDEKWSWNSTKTPTTKHLLGYSHGTSGIACALAQLFHATGDREFQRGAHAAWRYETSWFDATERNWPDFRMNAATTSASESQGGQFASSWCHGAPGTALALARQIALDPQSRPQLETVLTAALETTIASLSPQPRNVSGASFCLCHGIAGNADILLQIAYLAGRTDPDPVVLAAARAGMDRHHDSGNWPCGVPGGDETPALLLGLAGIGHFYLRLHDTSVPSPLIL